MSDEMFEVLIDGTFTLSVEDVWPDGNAPANPTAVDVAIEMRKEDNVLRLIREWNLHPVVRVQERGNRNVRAVEVFS